MTNYIEKLPWDTDFFSFSIGRVTASVLDPESYAAILTEAHQGGLQCLYFEADPNVLATVAIAEENHFHLADVRVVFEYPFENHPAPLLRYPIPSDLLVTAALETDMPRLECIAMEVGQFSRFTFDRNFRPGDDKELYRLWIQNSRKGLADAVYVARWSGQNSDAVGLITCAMKDRIGHIQLAGVHHEHRQKGVGTGLVQIALDWGRRQGAQRMEVVTQARNIPAQRLYEQMGFFTKSMTLFYHIWV
jgi:ribosomal protein S18 acetylase RimI-like enzyme